MNKSLLFRNRFYDFCLILLSFFILLYLIYQFIASNRGLLQYFILESEFSNKNNQYIKKLNTNTNLQKKINKLNPNSIDLDYLDELTRDKIGILKKNEVIVILSNN